MKLKNRTEQPIGYLLAHSQILNISNNRSE